MQLKRPVHFIGPEQWVRPLLRRDFIRLGDEAKAWARIRIWIRDIGSLRTFCERRLADEPISIWRQDFSFGREIPDVPAEECGGQVGGGRPSHA